MFGVLPTLSAAGAGVPDDLSIVGFEDAPLFRFWHPAVTVIDTQPKKIGAVAFEALMKEAGRASLPRTTPPLIIEVPAKLVIRSSAVAPRIEPNTVYPSG
jgi:DNA-binding LacI/PurR family transcriptional regulator